MTKRILLSLTVLAAMAAHATVPGSVDRAVAQVRAAASLDVSCTINGQPASLSLAGQCYSLTLGDSKVVYDGKTQWSLAAGEVTIFEPTADEVAESNPFYILSRLSADFRGAAVKGQPNTVRLKPTDPTSSIAEVTLTFNPANGWPTEMTIISGSGRADIRKIQITPQKTKKDPAAFKLDPPKGAIVNDLR